ncbi:MAG: carboxylating nicotinate-nucleotide diphosphorylase [Candidatus Omnitrophota bacterium]|nr:carboxylating nicotinate-nucleotide diphosphorylase [Candidatus Omnitrophota bacterium]
MALAEDAARNDITSRSVIPQKSRIKAAIVAQESGMLAGIDVVARVFTLQDNNLSVRALKKDGSVLKRGQAVLTVEGSARSLFAAERTALNLLGHLSGIATLTSQFVRRVRPFNVTILDTRKTLPGLRRLEKYAVRVGGGQNHRMDLQDDILIKTNHVQAVAREAYLVKRNERRALLIQRTIRQAKQRHPGKFVEIEVVNLKEFKAALAEKPHAILLDNWPLRSIRLAVRLRDALHASRFTLLEVSGGVTLANVRAIAATGVERISIGRLTHSAPSLDVALHLD